MVMLKVDKLDKVFNDHKVLDNINLDVEKGDVIAIIGPSGAGKSTFLRCLINLEQRDSGSVNIDGIELVQDDKNVLKKFKKNGNGFSKFQLIPTHDSFKECHDSPDKSEES